MAGEEKPALTLDCIGLYCPEPLFQTRQSIDSIEIGDVLEVIADDPAAEEDLKRFAKRAGHEVVSLENDGVAWSPTRTLTASALNSWIGEEVRVTGLEASLELFLPTADLALTGAVFGGNDPCGSLLAWRGWAVGDRQTGRTDRLPLAPLPVFGRIQTVL